MVPVIDAPSGYVMVPVEQLERLDRIITYEGMLPDEELRALLAAAPKVFVLASEYDLLLAEFLQAAEWNQTQRRTIQTKQAEVAFLRARLEDARQLLHLAAPYLGVRLLAEVDVWLGENQP